MKIIIKSKTIMLIIIYMTLTFKLKLLMYVISLSSEEK